MSKLTMDYFRSESKPENPMDLEDGEIEDGEIEDDDEVMQEQIQAENAAPQIVQQKPDEIKPEKIDRDKPRDRDRRDKRHKEKDTRHMTEAEKSILHLRRKERMDRERDKWVRRKEHQSIEPQDDFAIKLEKTLASILKKDRVTSDEDKEEERRGSKRKRKDKDGEQNAKHHKGNTPPSEEMEEKEMLNARGGSPDPQRQDKDERIKSPRSEFSYDSAECTSDNGKHEDKVNRGRRENKRDNKKNSKSKNKNRDRNLKKEKSRESKAEPTTDSKGICIFYLNGKCNKNDCIYSHEAVPPMKLELCKFYLMDCCAKGDNCSYMHSDFPCKFYHMGLPCNMGDQCKFSHGEPLSDGLKQILFKHIETAPRDILGGFPRLSREETLQMMDNTQKSLMDMYKEQNLPDQKEKKAEEGDDDGLIPSLFDISVPVPAELKDEPADSKSKSLEKAGRKNKPSRWQAAEPKEKASSSPIGFGPFNFTQDQDMRINSNGDIDMRTLPPHPQSSLPQPLPSSLISSDLSRVNSNPLRNSSGDVDIRNMTPNFASDVDIRLQSTFEVPTKGHPEKSSPFLGSKDIDIRQLGPPHSLMKNEEDKNATSQNKTGDSDGILSNLPKMQRELYLRIQSQQKENPPMYNTDYEDGGEDEANNDEDWYSDDDDEHRLTIKVDNEDGDAAEQKEEKTESVEYPSLPPINLIKPQEMVEKLGDLSKINITADITKLLSSLSSAIPTVPPVKPADTAMSRDPRQSKNQGVTINSPNRSPISSGNESLAPLAPRTLSDPRLGNEQKLNQASEAPIRDPRRGLAGVAASRSEKMSIYEQGGLNLEDGDASEEYKASSRPDVDLRTLGLPFKGVDSYIPATEIDASFSAHLPISWKVVEVDVPRPDYSGLKLSLDEAEKTGDPRLRKIFRLSVEERDTPLSPKASPQRPTAPRIDPRLRKAEEAKALNSNADTMNYNQQLNTLQSSAFYQSLTSNQKLMLNQELASRSDQTGSHDPILNSILANLNLLPGFTGGSTMQPQSHGANFGVAANILSSISKMTAMSMGPNINPNMMNPNNPMMASMVQPGLLGAAPGIPNMPQQDFPMNFDPRNPNGLLGNGPTQQFNNFETPLTQGGFQNYPNDDFYPPENPGGFRGGNQGRNDRGGNFNNRERRRGGRNNFGRNQGSNNQFRRNRGGGRPNKGHNQS